MLVSNLALELVRELGTHSSTVSHNAKRFQTPKQKCV